MPLQSVRPDPVHAVPHPARRFVPALRALLLGLCLAGLAGGHAAAAPVAATAAATPELANRIVRGVLETPGAAAVINNAPSLGYVIDNTADMDASLPGIREGINSLLDRIEQAGGLPPQLLLETFNDPTVGTPQITSNPDEFRAWLLGIVPSGGGDCPELAMTGLIRAIGAAAPHSVLFLFTNADAVDCDKSLLVVGLARSKDITIFSLLTGACIQPASASQGNARPGLPDGGRRRARTSSTEALSTSACASSFLDVAALTGGHRIDVSGDDVSHVLTVSNTSVESEIALLANVTGSLGVNTTTRTFPVDSTVERAYFVVDMDLKQGVVLRKPNGAVLNLNAPGVMNQVFSRGQVTVVDSPDPGNWSVEMTGGGRFDIMVLVNSPISLTEFHLVTVSGPIGSPIYTPLPQFPRNTGTLKAILGFAGVALPTQTTLIDDAGATVQSFTIASAAGLGFQERLATLPGGATPFRARIAGTDNLGYAYQRVSPQLTRPADVMLSAFNVPDQMSAGGTFSFNVTVQNFGATRTFDFVADADIAMDAVNVTPAQATLPTNGSTTLTIQASAPLAILETIEGAFAISARTATGEGNVLVVPELFIENQPPDCSGAYVIGFDTSHPSGNLEPIAFGGIVDPEGQPVAVEILDVFQDEPVDHNTGAEANRTCPDATNSGGVAMLRNERATSGNGRVYSGHFVASDPQGKQCGGTFEYCVPRSHARGNICTNDGTVYASAGPCARFNFAEPAGAGEPALVVRSSAPGRVNLAVTAPPAGALRMEVFDVAGRLLRTLWDGPVADSGLDLAWDTSTLPGGLYFVRAEVAGVALTRKVLVTR